MARRLRYTSGRSGTHASCTLGGRHPPPPRRWYSLPAQWSSLLHPTGLLRTSDARGARRRAPPFHHFLTEITHLLDQGVEERGSQTETRCAPGYQTRECVRTVHSDGAPPFLKTLSRAALSLYSSVLWRKKSSAAYRHTAPNQCRGHPNDNHLMYPAHREDAQ